MIVIEDKEAGGVTCRAPAKLNLFLEVLGKRTDGYHELETLMVTVDLHDTLTIRRRPVGPDLPPVRRPDPADRGGEPGRPGG